MTTDKNYAEMTLEELASEEKKGKSQQVMNAVLGGIVFGVAIYAATHHKGFLFTVFLLIVPFLIGRRNAQHLKDVRAEMGRRGMETEG